MKFWRVKPRKCRPRRNARPSPMFVGRLLCKYTLDIQSGNEKETSVELAPTQWRLLEELLSFLRPFHAFVVSFQVRFGFCALTVNCSDWFTINWQRLPSCTRTSWAVHTTRWRIDELGNDQIDASIGTTEQNTADDWRARQLLHTSVYCRHVSVAEMGTACIDDGRKACRTNVHQRSCQNYMVGKFEMLCISIAFTCSESANMADGAASSTNAAIFRRVQLQQTAGRSVDGLVSWCREARWRLNAFCSSIYTSASCRAWPRSSWPCLRSISGQQNCRVRWRRSRDSRSVIFCARRRRLRVSSGCLVWHHLCSTQIGFAFRD